MTALELLLAELEIVGREADAMKWTLDPEPGMREPGSDTMTPRLASARLNRVVDGYVYDGSLSAADERLVRNAIDSVVGRAREAIEARMGAHRSR